MCHTTPISTWLNLLSLELYWNFSFCQYNTKRLAIDDVRIAYFILGAFGRFCSIVVFEEYYTKESTNAFDNTIQRMYIENVFNETNKHLCMVILESLK